MASRSRHTAEVRYSAQMQALVAEVRSGQRAQEQAIKGVTDAIRQQATGLRGLGNDAVRLRATLGGVASAAREAWQLVTYFVEGAAERNQRVARQVETWKAAWEDLRAEIGERLVDAADKLVDGFNDVEVYQDRVGLATERTTQRTDGLIERFVRLQTVIEGLPSLPDWMRTAYEGSDVGQFLAGQQAEQAGALGRGNQRLRAWLETRAGSGFEQWRTGGGWGSWANENLPATSDQAWAQWMVSGPGAWASDQPADDAAGGGRSRDRNSTGPWAGMLAAEEELAGIRDRALEQLQAWTDRRLELGQMATDAIKDQAQQQADIQAALLAIEEQQNAKRIALVNAEITAQTGRADATKAALSQMATTTAQTIGSVIQDEEKLRAWRAAVMLAEVGWQLLVLGNPLGAGQALFYYGLYEAAGAISASTGRGGGGGGRSSGRRSGGGGGGGYDPSSAGGLLNRPPQGDLRPVVINVINNGPVLASTSPEAEQWAATVVGGAIRRELLRLPRG